MNHIVIIIDEAAKPYFKVQLPPMSDRLIQQCLTCQEGGHKLNKLSEFHRFVYFCHRPLTRVTGKYKTGTLTAY